MIGKFYTYKHTRPDTNEVFYIGKGFKRRAWDKNNRSLLWNNIVNKNNGNYTVEIITDNLLEVDAVLHEIYLIEFYGRRDLGKGTLVNFTNGGEGCSGSIANKGKKRGPQSQKHRDAISIANKGRRQGEISKEHRIKLSLAHKDVKKSAEHSKNIGLGHQKKVINNDTGEIFSSLQAVKDRYKISSGHLSNILKGRNPKINTFSYYKL